MSLIRAVPLSQEALGPLAEMLDLAALPVRVVNQGRAHRFDLGSAFPEPAPAGGRPRLAVYAVAGSRAPVAVPLFERHPFSAQTFLPHGPGGYLTVLAPDAADGGPDLSRAVAVHGRGVGITYRRGVWHAPMVALEAPLSFTMAMWETGRGDTQEWPLPAPLTVTLP